MAILPGWIGKPLLLATLAALAVPAVAQDKPEAERTRTKRPEAPKVGDVAPPVKLEKLGTEKTVDIADFQGKRPVVLIFGSYT